MSEAPPAVLRTATTPASWEDGLVVGSGRVGAVLHGTATHHVLSLAHERFFVPLGDAPPAPDVRPVLADLRAAVLVDDPALAGRLLTGALQASGLGDGLVWTDPLGICATLEVVTDAAGEDPMREIDLEHGEVAVSSRGRGGQDRVRVLAVRDSGTVWLAIESADGLTASLALTLGGSRETSLDTGGADASAAVRVSLAGGTTARLVASTTLATATVEVDGGEPWQVDGDRLVATVTVPPGGRRLLRVDVGVGTGTGTPAAGPTPGARAGASVAAAAEHHLPHDDDAWHALRARQARTHGALVGASRLDLGTAGLPDAGARACGTTEDVWAAARAGDARARRRVVEIAYLSGRANAIASTGELPPTLQGVWQGTWRPAWSADYTLNGNVQNGGIAGLLWTGTPELARSLLTLVLEHTDDYRENARRVFGAEGMLLPARMSTHGRADHVSAEYPHVFWTGCGGWVLRVAADLVSVTGDRDVVDDALWSLVEGVLTFAETATVPVDGRRHLVPSYSPENTPRGAAGPIAADATMDVAILRDAARAAGVLARARGDHSLDARWAALAASLPDYRIAPDGTLAEWLTGPAAENHEHRHASHLYPLWYEPDPAFTEPDGAALRAAALAAVHARLAWRAADPTPPPGRMEMAFGLVQLGLAAAALGDADAALRCVEWLAVDHWRPALTTTHDAGSIFNLDASGGLPALVAAMLLGSTADSLTLLPAVPAAWPSGGVTGLRARGGVVVDRLEWDPAGCTATLRRLPAAGWLAPAGGVRLAAGRPFVAAGPAVADGRLVLSDRPTTVRLSWTR